jgi:hypothetical protein
LVVNERPLVPLTTGKFSIWTAKMNAAVDTNEGSGWFGDERRWSGGLREDFPRSFL